MIPPVLEVYVVWHPGDRQGAEIAHALLDHFHGPVYSGLIGGAVEVYERSAGWDRAGGPPRPLPFTVALPHDLPRATTTAVVPVLGVGMARAAQRDQDWLAYIEGVADGGGPTVGVFPITIDAGGTDGPLGDVFGDVQQLDRRGAERPALLAADLAQAIAKLLGDPLKGRLTVFLSHTKWHSGEEQPDGDAGSTVEALVALVRTVIGDTHLGSFFDAADIQPGDRWDDVLRTSAASSALLAIRTDRYASREWCQREMLTAKRYDLPVVTLHALTRIEERGSFLLDHVPVVPLVPEAERESIERALHLLVDEALKRALWNAQRARLDPSAFAWLPAHAPEPATMIPWLRERQAAIAASEAGGTDGSAEGAQGGHAVVLHPDPPIGPDEHAVLAELSALAGTQTVEILTPRTFASRGGRFA